MTATETCKICQSPIVREGRVPKAKAPVPCSVCGKTICAACRKRAFTCPDCKTVVCPACNAKIPHACTVPAPAAKPAAAAVPGAPIFVRMAIGEWSAEVVAIRILPMSREAEFSDWTLEQVRVSFLGEALRRRGGTYRFARHGMRCDGPTLVLFQMEGHVIGSGLLTSVETFSAPEEGHYHGQYRFDPSSIRTIAPADLAAFRAVVPEVLSFSQAKQSIPLERAEALGRFLSQAD